MSSQMVNLHSCANEKRIIECAIIDNENNQIKTFFTGDLSLITIYKLKDNTKSYLENTDTHINIYISEEMSKNLLI